MLVAYDLSRARPRSRGCRQWADYEFLRPASAKGVLPSRAGQINLARCLCEGDFYRVPRVQLRL